MITVRFFAMLKGLAGIEMKEYDLGGLKEIKLSSFKAMIIKDLPGLNEALTGRSILISINQEFAAKDAVVRDGDEVGFLPPFSGG